MKKKVLALCLSMTMIVSLAACSGKETSTSSAPSASAAESTKEETAQSEAQPEAQSEAEPTVDAGAVDVENVLSHDLELGQAPLQMYQPKKNEYNFYMTYKLVHAWWDSVGIGIYDAVDKYAEMGITINVDYNAPVSPDASDQVARIEQAAGANFDVIGVDVCDIDIVTPTINRLVEGGTKIMTFSSSDATKEDGCNRIAYVGNTHNYQDGVDLAEELAKLMNYEGQVAALCGTIGAPCHEDRKRGFEDVMAKYPNIEVVDMQYDNDSVEAALSITEGWLSTYPDLKGIFANNMGNPIGASQAVIDAGKTGDIIITGMDHDLRALQYLRDGVISALGIQDCYKMGFDTIQVAIMIADGLEPGDGTFPEQLAEETTICYPQDAQAIINFLYPDAS